jgi:hypothetical protein
MIHSRGAGVKAAKSPATAGLFQFQEDFWTQQNSSNAILR